MSAYGRESVLPDRGVGRAGIARDRRADGGPYRLKWVVLRENVAAEISAAAGSDADGGLRPARCCLQSDVVLIGIIVGRAMLIQCNPSCIRCHACVQHRTFDRNRLMRRESHYGSHRVVTVVMFNI